MDSWLLEAAKEGRFEEFEYMEPEFVVDQLVTLLENTILHVHIMSQHSTKNDDLKHSVEFVDKILEKFPKLLPKVNKDDETLFHMTAKYGHLSALQALVDHAKKQNDVERGITFLNEMLMKQNKQKNTALHLAVLHDYKEVVDLLVNEDIDYQHEPNTSGETPLYLAAEKASLEMVDSILNKYSSPAHEGPHGRTALHAAAIWDDHITMRILERKFVENSPITRATDQNGWTALHYASYEGKLWRVKMLLNYDVSVAMIADKQKQMTALHLAACQGHYDVMEAIISRCPDCCHLVDSRWWNALHFAMCSLSNQELESIVKNNQLLKNLLDQKDEKGHDPLHVRAAIRPRTLLYRDSELPEFHKDFNDQKITVRDIMRGEYAQTISLLKLEIQDLSKGIENGPYYKGLIKIIDSEKDEDKEILAMTKKANEYHLVVAALIATVTFTAAFTLPGGYRSDNGKGQGMAILWQNSAFQTFVVTNTMSFTLSLSAVLLHFLMSIEVILRNFRYLFHCALGCTIIAMVAMVLAFVTGSYAVLSPSLRFSIVNCFLGLSFFIFVLLMTGKLIQRLLEEIAGPMFKGKCRR